MNSQTFHAHFFQDDGGRWCISVRLPNGMRTSPRFLTPVQIYHLLPWVEALGIHYRHLVHDERDVELWISQAFDRLECERARARSFEKWEVGMWWSGVISVGLGSMLLGIGVTNLAVVLLFSYFPISLSRDAFARSAARQHERLRPMVSSFPSPQPKAPK